METTRNGDNNPSERPPVKPTDYLTPGIVGSGFIGAILAVQQLFAPVIAQNNEILTRLAKVESVASRVEIVEKMLLHNSLSCQPTKD